MFIRAKTIVGVSLLLGLALAEPVRATEPAAAGVLFQGVRIFDGSSPRLSTASYVLVVGRTIERVSTTPIIPPAGMTVTRIEGGGRTLMPGLIDAHTHLVMAEIPLSVVFTSDPNYLALQAGRAATATLMRGFTSVRDVAGPTFGLKRAIDEDVIVGPRIWPSGAAISQTSGHGDFRSPHHDLPGMSALMGDTRNGE